MRFPALASAVIASILAVLIAGCAHRATPTSPPATPVATPTALTAPIDRVRQAINRPVMLRPEDKAAFPDPPSGFDLEQPVKHGQFEMVSYHSNSVGSQRRMLVYLPPGYTTNTRYPVLYLLHGIGGDETEWQRAASPNFILDNLIARGEITPFIAVFPNGRAQPNDRADGDIFASAPAFGQFGDDLIGSVIPTIEKRYSTKEGREYRALAGLSMGGGQSLNIGVRHLDIFSFVGAFSPAPNTNLPKDLVEAIREAPRSPTLLWLSCGNKDGLINVSQGVQAALKENSIPHIWHVDGNGHDSPEWKSSLYWFSKQLFR